MEHLLQPNTRHSGPSIRALERFSRTGANTLAEGSAGLQRRHIRAWEGTMTMQADCPGALPAHDRRVRAALEG